MCQRVPDNKLYGIRQHMNKRYRYIYISITLPPQKEVPGSLTQTCRKKVKSKKLKEKIIKAKKIIKENKMKN